MHKILNSGIEIQTNEYLKNKVYISNIIALFYAMLSVPFIVFTSIIFPELTLYPSLFFIVACSIPVLNRLGFLNFSRFIISIVFVSIYTMYECSIQRDNQPFYSSLISLNVMFIFLPWVLFDFREKEFLIIYNILNGILFISLTEINSIFTINNLQNTELFRDGTWLSYLLFATCFIGFVGASSILLNNNFINEKRLLKSVEKSKEVALALKDKEEKMNAYVAEIEQNKIIEKQRQWTNEGIAIFSNILRENNENIQSTYDKFLSTLVKYINANQALLFTVEQKNNDSILSLKAAYAYNRKKYIEKELTFGEGLVGQAWAEKDIVFITEVPEEYIQIKSGLGESSPKCICIVPAILNDKVEGILEFASFRVLSPFEIDFLKKISEILASSIFMLNNNEKTNFMLQELTLNTENLRAQEEEMRQNMEELQATQEEILRKDSIQKEEIERLENLHKQSLEELAIRNERIQTANEEMAKILEKTELLSKVADKTDNSVIITDNEGKIEYVNPGFTKLTGYLLDEIKGKKPGEFLQGPDTDKKTVARIREKLNNKQPFYEEILNYDKKGNSYWISLSINPVFNTENEVTGYVSVQANITETKLKSLDFTSQLEAINKSYIAIEFDTKGYIIDANKNFTDAMGFTLDEIKGKHHSIFVLDEEKNSEGYKKLWEKLGRGEFVTDEFKRKKANGEIVWLRGSYNGVIDIVGKPYKVVKYAMDITKTKILEQENHKNLLNITQKETELQQTIEEMRSIQEEMSEKDLLLKSKNLAINNTLAQIEFTPEGHILNANSLFLKIMNYSLEEIQLEHHKIFVQKSEANSPEYLLFWKNLSEGKSQSGEFKRINKNGKSIWLRATYTPIIDEDGKVEKILKLAFDITKEKNLAKDFENQLEAISKSNAIVEFDTKGNILTANENFLTMMGYDKSELINLHHSTFVTQDDKNSDEYKQFWNKLAKGEFISGEFKRITKTKNLIHIKGSYNPILDENGAPYKIVKYAVQIGNSAIKLEKLIEN